MSNLRIENLAPRIELDPMPKPVQQMPGSELQGAGEGPPGTFADMLKKTIDTVNRHQTEADQAIKEVVAGRNKNIHEAMLAVERAELSLKLMTQVRNKILEAYKEVMRMQV
jgi:flagellar hook-basal body complex protein FliE